MGRKSTLYVYEFPPGEHDWQSRDLFAGLARQDPKSEFRFCYGFMPHYRPGGLAARRILNGAWVHVRAFFAIMFGSFGFVIVRSSPPLIQITTAVACRLRGVRHGIWLMDAHPELEAAIWGTVPLLGALSRWLVRVNRWALNRAAFVVVLDDAMRVRLVPDLDLNRVIVCPTWGKARLAAPTANPEPPRASSALKFLYLGNLGAAHDIPAMCKMLALCAKSGHVTLTFIGSSPESVADAARGLEGTGVDVQSMPPIPLEQLDRKVAALGLDFGIISLGQAFAGLLSPSKYIGYLVARIPLVYLGPPGNNAADVCTRFGAGLHVQAHDLADGTAALATRLRDSASRGTMQRNTETALRHFEQFDGGEFLATQVGPRLRD